MTRSLRRRAARLGPTAVTVTGGRLPCLRCVAIVGLLLMLPSATAAQPTDDTSAVPRLPGGAPDLQGIWLYWSETRLERPEEFSDNAVVTPEEAAAHLLRRDERSQGNQRLSGDWNRRFVGRPGLLDGRTSLVIDPPNGKLPARTEAGQHWADTLGRAGALRPADGPEDRDVRERCVMGPSVPLLPRPFDSRVMILQTPRHIVIQDEEGDLRLIPVTETAPLSESIRQWAGSSRGHWEGDTLVVETTHFNGKWSFQGAGPQMRLVERFTRTAGDTLDYEFTVHDEESFDRAWTVKFPLTRDAGPIYEYACHEGNRSVSLILSGARALERGATK